MTNENADALAEAAFARGKMLTVRGSLAGAWHLLRRDFGSIAGTTALIYSLIFLAGEIPRVGAVVSMIAGAPLLGGLYAFYLKMLRREPARLRDIGEGFGESFPQLLLNGLVTAALSTICLYPGLRAMQEPGIESDPIRAAQALLVLAVGALPVAVLAFLWVFARPLTIDKKLPFWRAMQLSRQVVARNAWRLGLLLFVASVLAGAGLFVAAMLLAAMGVGVPTTAAGGIVFAPLLAGLFTTLPIYVGALMFALQTLFGTGAVDSTD